jgi:hypothetical protein
VKEIMADSMEEYFRLECVMLEKRLELLTKQYVKVYLLRAHLEQERKRLIILRDRMCSEYNVFTNCLAPDHDNIQNLLACADRLKLVVETEQKLNTWDEDEFMANREVLLKALHINRDKMISINY